MANFEAVLFDWMLTLAHYPPPADHVVEARRRLGRPDDLDEVRAIVAGLAAAMDLPEVRQAEAVWDTSVEAHHRYEHLLYERAGIDEALADQMYSLLGQPSFHPCYPDAARVLRALHRDGMRIGVVSDIHVDLRVHAEEFGFGRFVDAWALSFELGVQKPDQRIFEAALSSLDVTPDRSLMVGDRASRDGAAAALGLTCLVLPPPTSTGDRGLDHVLHLAGVA